MEENVKVWQAVMLALVIALAVAWFSNRQRIPYVNPGKVFGAPKPPMAA